MEVRSDILVVESNIFGVVLARGRRGCGALLMGAGDGGERSERIWCCFNGCW